MTGTCLIVDDARVVRRVARKILEDLSFECEEVENGQAAVEWCSTRMPDAILLDWNMPELDGIAFLRQLRQMDGGDGPKVVMCTGRKSVDDIKEALDAGADEYVMKPFDSDIVHSKFRLVGLLS